MPTLAQFIWNEWRWTTGAQAHTMAGDTKTSVQPLIFPDEESEGPCTRGLCFAF